MSNEPKKSLPRIRTFAQDLEMEREKHHLPPTADVQTKPVVATPVAAAAVAADVKISEKPIIADSAKHDDAISASKLEESNESKIPPAAAKSLASTEPPAPVIKISVRDKKRSLAAPRTEGGGTVITDNKKVSPSFFAAISNSLNTWIKGLQKKKKATTPKYTVVDSERRKGVIQKATTKTGSIFTADSETLAEEVRRRQTTTVTRKPSQDGEISWTPNTEVGYPLLPGTTTNVQVEFKKRTIPVPEIVEPAYVPPPIPPTIVVREKVKPIETPPSAKPAPIEPAWEQTEPPIIIPKEITPPENREVPTWASGSLPESAPPTPIDAETPPPSIKEELDEEDTYELTTPEAHYRIRSIGDVTKINTNYLSLGVVGAVTGLVALIFIIRALFLFLGDTSLPVSIEAGKPLLDKATVVDTELSALTKDAFSIALQQTDTDMPGTREIRFFKADKTLVSKEEFAGIAGINAAPRISQAATDIRFAHIGTERGIIIEVTDPTNALGSLLEWEPTMVRDIGLIFGITRSAEPLTFTDVQIAGVDARVATIDENPILIYGFIDQNTIIITESTLAFTEAVTNK